MVPGVDLCKSVATFSCVFLFAPDSGSLGFAAGSILGNLDHFVADSNFSVVEVRYLTECLF